MTAGPLGKIGYQKIPAERTFDYNFQVGCSQNIGKLVKSHIPIRGVGNYLKMGKVVMWGAKSAPFD